MAVLTAEETRHQYERQMGVELGGTFYALVCEIVSLHEKWSDYLSLFGTNEARVALLNRASPGFFGRVQDTMWDDLLLHIARLTDAPASGRNQRKNLTLKRISLHVSDLGLKEQLSVLLAGLDNEAEFCRDWRNRRLAHGDLTLSLDESAHPLATASRHKVDLVLKAVAGIVNLVSEHFTGSGLEIDGAGPHDDSYELLRVIDDGLRERERRRARFNSGEPLPSDYSIKDL